MKLIVLFRRQFGILKNINIIIPLVTSMLIALLIIPQISFNEDYLQNNIVEIASRIWIIKSALLSFTLWIFGVLIVKNNFFTKSDKFIYYTQIFGLCIVIIYLVFLFKKNAFTDNEIVLFTMLAAANFYIYYIINNISEHSPYFLCTSLKPINKKFDYIIFLVIVFTIYYILFFASTTTVKHYNFATNSFDLGIFDNLNYKFANLKSSYNTFENLNHFKDVHFSPILLLFTPLYLIFKSPLILLITQSLLLGIPSILIYLISLKLTSQKLISFSLSISYLLSPALHGANNYDFHEVSFLPVLILGAFYCLLEKRNFIYFILIIFICFVKEDSSLSAFMIGIYAFSIKEKKIGYITCTISIVYFLLVTKVIMNTLMISRFSDFTATGIEGLEGIIATLLSNPAFVIKFILSYNERIFYWFILMVPVLFLPLWSKSIFVIILPAAFISLLSNSAAQNGIDFQYSACILPFVYMLTIIGLTNIGKNYYNPVAILVLVNSFLINSLYGGLYLVPRFVSEKLLIKERSANVIALLNKIPADATVSATNHIGPHMSGRDSIFMFPNIANAQYIVFDSKTGFWPLESISQGMDIIEREINEKRYGIVTIVDGCVLLKKDFKSDKTLISFKVKFKATQLKYNGIITLDSAASDNTSLKIDLKGTLNSYPIYGPFIKLNPGKYKVRFRLKHDKQFNNEDLLILDVYKLNNPVYKSVKSSDFKEVNQYQYFDIALDLTENINNLEFRIFSKGIGHISFDCIEIWEYKNSL